MAPKKSGPTVQPVEPTNTTTPEEDGGVASVATLQAEVAARAELEAMPWSLTIVEHVECAEYLRSMGVAAVALAEPAWRDELPAGGVVLLIDRAQRIAGDVQRLGVVECYGAQTPVPYRWPSEYLEARAAVAGYAIGSDGLAELWRVVTDRAKCIEVAPTGHPDLAPRPKRQTRLHTLAEIEAMPPVRWLVQRLVPAPGVGFIVGPPNVGKTAVAFDVAMRVLHGLDFLGRRVAPGSVLYVVGEGVAGIGTRSAAWRSAHACEEPAGRYFAVATKLPPLSSPAGVIELRETIDELVTKHGHAPAFVVVDTLSAHWAESEDKSEFAAPAMAALQQLGADHGVAVLLLHHERKPTKEGGGGALAALRGSGAWAGSADFVLTVKGEPAAIEIGTAKQRDAERGAPMHCRLVVVDLGVGEDGEPLSSIVVVPADPAEAANVDPVAARKAEDRDVERRIAVALLDLGTATRVDAIVRRAGVRLTDGRDAVDRMLADGRMVGSGTYRRMTYRMASAAACSTVPPDPPCVRDASVAGAPLRPERSSDVSGRIGTRDASSIDGGRPERPGARRSKAKRAPLQWERA